ncbi:putative short-subunit dehydrogenase-like oxidoreductase (DUF2520 family) [Krasilnikovia cinnamomea]|uniref:Putative short-subunit dehydrogenase-like oxidoreductase (DUF2520 family) n=1 Tax=Krasilnikovia cinnamomea TaxID=349313 RepID=A0A4Q7ZJ80_9ACTN|nr:Rossmann-like and DUF2520 domain-containing protein [Krasilnikovia cinnamomea]RZU50930.1 putative short-subunit dehydrogenase-like oxidoreductase (DUF2520 family) [Krasilnikovia cinnamomea]
MRNGSVGIVGGGRVGTALGQALQGAGYQVVGVSARSAQARDRCRRRLPGVPVLTPHEVAARSSLTLLSVPDDAIASVCGELAAAGALAPGRHVMHASGACGLAVLREATAVGATPLAVHPAMTFPGGDSDAEHVAGIAFAVTAPPEARDRAEGLVRDLGGVPVWIAEADRTLYHAALVLGANNLVTLTAAAMQALGAAGVPDPGFILGPLVRTTLENALRLGDDALTGPVRRGDTATIGAHVSTLRERVPALVPGYLQFARVTAERALAANLGQAASVERVVAMLTEALSATPASASSDPRVRAQLVEDPVGHDDLR